MTMPVLREEPDWVLIKIATKTNAPFQDVTSRYLMKELSTEQVVQHVGSDSLHTYSRFLTSSTDPCHRESIRILTRKISRAFSHGCIPSNLPQSLQAYLRFLTWVADSQNENSMKLLLDKIDRTFSQRKIPSNLWGYIASFAPSKDALALRQVCTRFSSPEFITVAFKGRENNHVNRKLRELIKEKMPLKNRLLEALAPNVTKLDLHDLPITADTISELAKLFPHTTELILDGILNPKAAEIIPSLSNFKNLTSLRLRELDLHDEDIAGLTPLITLQTLDIERNAAITGKTFDLLPPTLVALNCSDCGITDEAIPKLSHLPGLQKLRMKGNRKTLFKPTGGSLQGTTFHHLPSSLLKLKCSFCDITDEAIAQLSHLQRLQKLNLGNTYVTGSTFEYLPLSLLELDYDDDEDMGNITDEVIPKLSRLENLRALSISSPNVEGSTFEYLPSSLRTLFCSGCELTDEAIRKFSRLENLEKLYIFYSSGVTGSTFGDLPSSIRFLEFRNCELTDEAIAQLSHLKNLEYLHLFECTGVKGSTFEHLPSSIRTLWCHRCELTDEAVAKLSHLKNLEKLYLSGNRGVTGSTFEFLPSSIRWLDCASCNLTDQAVAKLAHLEKLGALILVGNKLISGTTFQYLPSTITYLSCKSCGITDEAILQHSHRRE